MLENRVLRRTFGSKRKEVVGSAEYCIIMICTLHRVFFRVIKPRRMRWVKHAARMGVGRGGEVHVGFWWGNCKGST